MKLAIDRFTNATAYLLDESGDVVAEQPCLVEVKLGRFTFEVDLVGEIVFRAIDGPTITQIAYKYEGTSRHCAMGQINITPNGGDITIVR